MRRLAIDRDSAVNVTKWRVGQIAADPATPSFKRFALKAALSGGNIEEIIDEVYKMGFAIAANEDSLLHQKMLAAGSIVRES